jgi:hypothetical protein
MYRKNTASQYVYFCLVNASTGAALTGATVTAYRALDAASQASATGTTTELANGQYRFNLSQADTNANNGSFLFTATGAVPVEKTIVFTAADPTDATAFGLSRIDGTITSRMATYTQPTGFLAATFPTTVASTTNITAATGVVLSGVTHTGAVIPTVSAVTGLTASNLDAAVSSRMATYTQPTGFLAATFPTTVASTTNITSATGVTVSTIGANVITAGSIAASALDGKGNWNVGKTGYALSTAGIQAIWDAATSLLTTVGSIGKLLVDNINATISSRSTYAGGDTSGTTTLLTRIVGTLAAGTHNAQSGDSFARLGAPLGASVSADILAALAAAEDARDSAIDAASFANDASSKIPVLRYGTAQAGAASTITLDAGASSITDYYVGIESNRLAVAITSGTGAGQIRAITAYNGTTKVATVDSAWTTNPANGSLFSIVQAASSGGGTDWSSNERTAIKAILGIPSSGSTPADPTVGILDTIRDNVGNIPNAAQVAAAIADEPLAGHTTPGTLGKVLSDAGSGVALLLGRITNTVYTMFIDLVQMITNDGTASAQWSNTAMQNIPVAGGSGARSVTITVRDSSANAIQNATVRVYRTGESFALSTNASGLVAFSLDDATWGVAITATGFSFTPASLIVSANVAQTYTLTAAGGGITPSTTPMTTGYWIVYDLNGTPQVGTQVTLSAAAPPVGSTGIVMEDAPRNATTDANGVVQFSNLIKGATYVVNRTGSTRRFNILVPTSAGTSVALGSIVG